MEIIVKSLPEFIEQVLLHQDKTNQMIYRGHASCKFELKTSVGRIKDYTSDLEKRLFLEFKKLYRPYTSERPQTDLELLFMAQHYGIPTRLLDWTYNPLVALYFATDSNDNYCNGKVYMIGLHESYKVEELKDISLSIDRIMSFDKCRYVEPYYTDGRYYNQKSIFLLSNMPDRQFTFADNETVFFIDRNSKSQIRKDLELFGIDESFIYPTLDNLSKDIKTKMRIEMRKPKTCGRNGTV